MTGDLFNEPAALKDLNEAQRHAVSLGKGPILVIAGAGTGKTRTLVHRVAFLVEQGIAPESILLLTFTRRAAEEMLSRAHALNPACAAVPGGTFHSISHRLLRSYGERIGLSQRFTVIDPADCQQIIKGAVQELGLKQTGERRFPKNRTIVDLISKSRNLELSLDETIETYSPHLLDYSDRIHSAAQAYTQAKREQHLVDYDDLLYLTEKLLKEHSDLREQLTQRWQHHLVDEYQDTNAVQARLVELLAGPERNIMVVGDDAQSIYAFRGARLSNILEFPQVFPGTRLVKLERNYRSGQSILDLTNAVIAQARQRYDKRLYSEKSEGPKPEMLRSRDQRGQSRLVVERIVKLLDRGTKPEQIAVLFRAGRDSFDLENELKAERLGFIKYGGIRFIELAHVKDATAHLRVVANPTDFLSWQRLLMLLPGVGPKTAQQIIAHLVAEGDPQGYAARLSSAPQAGRITQLAELAALMESLHEPGLSPIKAVELVLDYYTPICQEAYEDYPRRLKDLEELPALASQSNNLAEFMAEVVLDPPEAPGQTVQTTQPLTLSTVHSAKGKEWDHVFVLWAAEGRFPAFPSLEDDDALEEELRLFYVACTRAAKELVLLAPREHYFEGTGWRPVPVSRFVDELSPSLLEQPSEGPVFPVPEPDESPVSRGSQRQDRAFAVGKKVVHKTFGQGKVMGYQGDKKIIVYFNKFGLKILLLEFANLQPA
jgi:DNA helicase-2/ATP-dependent DNA helicase PcrA